MTETSKPMTSPDHVENNAAHRTIESSGQHLYRCSDYRIRTT